MIIRLHASGCSFKSLANYITHDADKAQTSERVAWTHTLNCAHDHVPSAVHEMYTTMLVADHLKRDAGIRPGGRPLEKAVIHFSLSWDPTDRPSREHMIAAVESFLTHMGWRDQHQCILAGHTDKEHRHVHVMLNAVALDTGLKLNDSHDWTRAEAWGLQYEIGRGSVLCKQRLLPREERTPSPTRQTWHVLRAFEREDDHAEQQRAKLDYFDRNDGSTRQNREWKALKLHQREQREDWFAGGKQAYRETRMGAYQEVREEMRGAWHNYYQARAAGIDKLQLAATKAALIHRQNEILDQRCQVACVQLRHHRDKEYARLLQQQGAQRRDLGERQRQGLQTYRLSDQTSIIDKGNARAHSKRAQDRARTHGEATVAPSEKTICAQFRAAAFEQRTAAHFAAEIGREEEARQKRARWLQKPFRVPQPRVTNDKSRERDAAALRHAGDSDRKLREHEAGVRRAWVRARPARHRGRD